MFSLFPFNGAGMAAKTLCFTFDDGPGQTIGDGPGPKTIRLAEYLHAEGISAAFFCVGKFIGLNPGIIEHLDALGHIVGNHTYSHPNMVLLHESGGKDGCVSEIESTDELIRQVIPHKPVYFRAPYGLWKPDLSVLMNENLANTSQYIGPFFWDIGGDDYKFWSGQRSAEDCADSYLDEIENKGRGIILLHDSTADVKNMRLNNRTLETVKILVPVLKKRGYRFVGLDKIPR
jgi:peptidoglycan/xylan/chitin deacetylase (PgdA/CDA1 family)